MSATNLVQAGGDDSSARAAERVTESDGAATECAKEVREGRYGSAAIANVQAIGGGNSLDVRAVMRQAELVDQVAKHARECFVDFEEVDVLHLDTCALEHFRDSVGGSLRACLCQSRTICFETANTHDAHDARGETSNGRGDVLGHDGQAQLFSLATLHQQDTCTAVCDLRSVATGCGAITPLRESRANLAKSFGSRVATDTVVLVDGNLHSGGRGCS